MDWLEMFMAMDWPARIGVIGAICTSFAVVFWVIVKCE